MSLGCVFSANEYAVVPYYHPRMILRSRLSMSIRVCLHSAGWSLSVLNASFNRSVEPNGNTVSSIDYGNTKCDPYS